MKKIFFGIDMADDRGAYDSDRLTNKIVRDEQKTAVNRIRSLRWEIKYKIPALLMILGTGVVSFYMLLASIVLWLVLNMWLTEIGVVGMLEDFFKVYPWAEKILLVVWIAFIVGLAHRIIKHFGLKKLMTREQKEQALEEIAEIRKASMEMLEIPDDAKSVDIFSCTYRVKGNEPVIDKVERLVGSGTAKGNKARFDTYAVLPMRAVSFNNIDCWIYKQDGRIYISDGIRRMAIPGDGITGIQKIKKRVIFEGWNKPEKHSSSEYRGYGIKRVSDHRFEDYRVWNYYALTFTAKGYDFEMYFPAYELETIEEMTGLRYYDM